MKSVTVKTDKITDKLSQVFDYKFDGISTFSPLVISPMDRISSIVDEWGIGLIVGPSGSGKTTLLEEFRTAESEDVVWNSDMAVCSHFESAEDAEEKLSAVGFNTIPSWMRPYHVLSNGEKFRADLARRLDDGAVIDEYTSVVDRNVARACSVSIKKYVDRKNLKNLVFASCHYDIIDWLEPDWVFDTVSKTVENRRSLRRPEIKVDVIPCSVSAWSMFGDHHYLSGDINRGAYCWLAVWNNEPVGFTSVVALPSGSIKNAWRGHRTVVLPDFQGLGIGVRLSDAVAEMHIQEGKRFFSKTAHPRLGEYRQNSPKWRATSKNGIKRSDYNGDRAESKYSRILLEKHKHRVCYSHEYIG